MNRCAVACAVLVERVSVEKAKIAEKFVTGREFSHFPFMLRSANSPVCQPDISLPAPSRAYAWSPPFLAEKVMSNQNHWLLCHSNGDDTGAPEKNGT
jgi:hypothetical protein